MRQILTAALALTVAGAVASGCGGDAAPFADATPTSSVATTTTTTAATTSTTSTTSATTTTTAPERLTAASRLRIDGVGPITVGMSVAEARAAAGVDLVVERLPYCDLVTAPAGPTGLSLIVSTPASGRIDLVIVKEGPIATLSGIRVGATEADVLATYPGRLRAVNPTLPVHRLIYDGTDRVLVFVIDTGRVVTMYAGVGDQAEADEICA